MNILEIDVNVLIGIINMKLRDRYRDLDDLCDDLNINKEILIKRLAEGGYIYQTSNNQFISK